MKNLIRAFAIATLLLFALDDSAQALAQTQEKTQRDKPIEKPYIVARVGDSPIYSNEVENFLKRKVPKGINLPPQFLEIAQKESLEHLIDRKAVFAYLQDKDKSAGPNQIQLEFENLVQKLKSAGQTLESHLAKHNQTEEQLKFEIAWRLSWSEFLKQQQTAAFLKEHFQKHQRLFDGTTMKVAHLLLPTKGDAETDNSPQQTLEQILAQLNEKNIGWDEAVKKHSIAPSKENLGIVGWISIDGPMAPEFSQAAFKLNVNEISPPVKTNAGWHLVRCIEVKAGTTGWKDSQEKLRPHAARISFQKIAEFQRKKLTVSFPK